MMTMAFYNRRIEITDDDNAVSVSPRLTTETLRLVLDMDREQKQDGDISDGGAAWRVRSGSVGSGGHVGSRSWFYRKYSHQVLSRSPSEDDGDVFDAKLIRRNSKHAVDWDFDDIHSEVKKFVEERKVEDTDRAGKESDPSLSENVTNFESSIDVGSDRNADPGQSGDDVDSPVDDNAPRQANNLQRYADSLPVQAVDPKDYNCTTDSGIPGTLYSSTTSITLSDSNRKDTHRKKCKVVFITLTADDIDDYRESISST